MKLNWLSYASDVTCQPLGHSIVSVEWQWLVKAFTRKWSSLENVVIDKYNDAVRESELENFSQYFKVDDFKKAFNSLCQVTIRVTIFFHMDISSLSYNFDQLHTLLSEINISFDVIRITETQLNNKHQERQTLALMDITLNTLAFQL